MNKKSIKILEFNKIIQLLMMQAGSEMTRKVISELEPFNEERLVREGLDETEEAETLITVKGPLPLGNFYDIGDHIKLASKGCTLTMKQLLMILYNMKITRNTVNFLKGDLPPLPILKGIAEVLEVYRELEEEIDRCILSEDEMADDASSGLKSIRRDMIRQNEAVKDKIGSIINSSENRTMLQDYIVTMRDGRYVIPVKQEYKTRFPGVVHDQSASGATLFIEPQVIVDMNNRLRQLEIEEKAEIERILAELSEEIAKHYHGLMNNQELLVHMDLISAKGKLAKFQKAERPSISEEGHLALVSARHPLIEKDKVVPIDVSIGDMYNALIVTGPNTGGKTVTLKTAGLLCMMAQTGLFIPASSMSSVPVFCDIFADIGDEQSIEQSLST
ncbi:MAG TPA: endonuclease MutS2, partial [Bacillota bacterium]|nr:endonuclease MutS2 [Bacillota bacterium]